MLLAVSRRRNAVPENLIIGFNDIAANVPSGWSRFTSMDNKHPVGAGSTYAVGNTGGDAAGAISRDTSSDGDHTGGALNFAEYESGGSYNVNYVVTYGQTGGAHTHTLTANYLREYQQILLIKASQDHQQLPVNAIVFSKESTTPVTGLTICNNDNRLLRVGDTKTNGGGSLTDKAISSDGAHTHSQSGLRTSYNRSAGGNYPRSLNAGSHNHPYTMTLEDESLKRAYLTAWTDTNAFYGASGIIAMWEQATAPSGWYLCNGENGTLDLRDYFIILSSTGNAGNSYDQLNRVQTSGTITNVDWSHSHKGADVGSPAFSESAYHDTENHNHGHTVTTVWTDHTPIYYALTFIQMV